MYSKTTLSTLLALLLTLPLLAISCGPTGRGGGDDDDDDNDDSAADDDDTGTDDDDTGTDDDDTPGPDDDDTPGPDDDDDDTSAPCADDLNEPNNDFASATPFNTIIDPNNLRICEDDDDLFLHPIPPGMQLTITVLFDHDEGDIDLEIFDSTGNVVGSSDSISDDETVGPIEGSSSSGPGVGISVQLFEDDGSTPGNDYSIMAVIEKTDPG